MPVIARFNGMIIKIYYSQSEHNPPHFHVLYGDYMGVISIQTLEMLEGDLPTKELKLVKEWAKQYQSQLLNIWNTQEFIKLPPL